MVMGMIGVNSYYIIVIGDKTLKSCDIVCEIARDSDKR